MQHGDTTCCRLFLKDYIQYTVHHDHTSHDIHVCNNLPRPNTYLICPTQCPIVGKSYHNRHDIPYLEIFAKAKTFFLHEKRQVAAVNRVVDTNALTDIVPNYAQAPALVQETIFLAREKQGCHLTRQIMSNWSISKNERLKSQEFRVDFWPPKLDILLWRRVYTWVVVKISIHECPTQFTSLNIIKHHLIIFYMYFQHL